MATFHAYESQLLKLLDALQQQCSSAPSVSAGDRQVVIEDISKGIEDADSLIRQMDLEARTTPASERASLLSRLRELKLHLMASKRDLKSLLATNGPSAAAATSGGGDDVELSDSDQRARLLSSTARLTSVSASLADGRRTLQQTEHLGVTILQDLHRQRQSLMHSSDGLHEVDDMLTRSRQVLAAMARKMNRNKWIIGSILACLAMAICLLIYVKLR